MPSELIKNNSIDKYFTQKKQYRIRDSNPSSFFILFQIHSIVNVNFKLGERSAIHITVKSIEFLAVKASQIYYFVLYCIGQKKTNFSEICPVRQEMCRGEIIQYNPFKSLSSS